nr:translation initiation factor IF-2-like [Symphalangus syndactylus]
MERGGGEEEGRAGGGARARGGPRARACRGRRGSRPPGPPAAPRPAPPAPPHGSRATGAPASRLSRSLPGPGLATRAHTLLPSCPHAKRCGRGRATCRRPGPCGECRNPTGRGLPRPGRFIGSPASPTALPAAAISAGAPLAARAPSPGLHELNTAPRMQQNFSSVPRSSATAPSFLASAFSEQNSASCWNHYYKLSIKENKPSFSYPLCSLLPCFSQCSGLVEAKEFPADEPCEVEIDITILKVKEIEAQKGWVF